MMRGATESVSVAFQNNVINSKIPFLAWAQSINLEVELKVQRTERNSGTKKLVSISISYKHVLVVSDLNIDAREVQASVSRTTN